MKELELEDQQYEIDKELHELTSLEGEWRNEMGKDGWKGIAHSGNFDFY